jgi:predicted O-methyltransferase YrrM
MSLAEKTVRILRTTAFKPNEYIIARNLRSIGLQHASSIPTSVDQTELQALYYLARNSPNGATILEIGSYLGASTCYLAAGASKVNGQVLCVDTWMNETMPEGVRDTYVEFTKNTKGAKQWIRTIRKSSDQLSVEDIPAGLDLVFIDGDHSYEAVKRDFERITPWLTANGIVVFHDAATFEGVTCTIGEALVSGKWVVAGVVGNLCWLKRPPTGRHGKS